VKCWSPRSLPTLLIDEVQDLFNLISQRHIVALKLSFFSEGMSAEQIKLKNPVALICNVRKQYTLMSRYNIIAILRDIW